MVWKASILVAVEASPEGINGLGDTYAYGCVCVLITSRPAKAIGGVDILVPPAAQRRLAWAVNPGRAVGQAYVDSSFEAADSSLYDLRDLHVVNVSAGRTIQNEAGVIRCVS